MKTRVIAVIVIVGLALGLCIYGVGVSGSSDSSLPSEPAVAQTETESTQSAEVVEEVIPEEWEEVEEDAQEEYSVDELVNMWSSGMLTTEDIERKVAYGEIDYDVYEGFLSEMSEDEEFESMQSGEDTENNSISNDADLMNLMSPHVYDYETNDGYQLRETISLSPIFSDSDEALSSMYALWESLGGSTEEIPSKDQLYEMSQYLRSMHNANGCNNIKYIIGTRTVENLTDGFSITADNPYVVGNTIVLDKSYDNPDEDPYAKSNINLNTTTLVYYASGRKCELPVSSGITLGAAKMVSDSWGPVRFIIVLPDKIAPDTPTGFAYDSLRYTMGRGISHDTESFTLNNWDE